MRWRSTVMAAAAVLLPVAGQAQTMTKGTYATTPGHTTEVALPNGNMIEHGNYSMAIFADDPSSPMANISSDCTGAWVKSADGGNVSRSGSCFNMNDAGDGYMIWWRQTEMMTEKCAVACGVFGFYGGYGKFEGLTGKGNWRLKTSFANGAGMGEWDSSHSMKAKY